MATVNYPTPVIVNGFSCKNCTDVDNAKRHIDPQHPKDGPYGINAAAGPGDRGPAVSFGGALSGVPQSRPGGPAAAPATSGVRLDLTA